MTEASLIISTYNRKEALELSLLSVLEQTQMPAEIIVADDGSADDTRELIERYQKRFGVRLVHVWHPHEGFQLAKIRNRAVARSRCDYLVSIDGDQVLHPRFIEDHLAMAKAGAFLQGYKVLLNQTLTGILINQKRFKLSFLESGMSQRKNAIHSSLLRDLLGWEQKKLKGICGSNMSFWRTDLLKVNGFNEDFSNLQRQDSELALRLFNSGVKRIDLCFSAIAYHLFHLENPQANSNNSDEELDRAEKEKRQHCKKGLDQYPPTV
jgi:glycosyltransferase involved in cell wall biosynthesis